MTGDGHMRQLIYPMKEQYEEFLIDESKFSGAVTAKHHTRKL